MTEPFDPREALDGNPRCRLFAIDQPDDDRGLRCADLLGGLAGVQIEAWNAGLLPGVDPFRHAVRARAWAANGPVADVLELCGSLGIALSTRAAEVMGQIAGDACEFVPVVVESAAGVHEWLLPNLRETVQRVGASRVVSGRRRDYRVVPASAIDLRVFRCRVRDEQGPSQCVLRRDVCEALLDAGIDGLGLCGVVDEGVLVGR